MSGLFQTNFQEFYQLFSNYKDSIDQTQNFTLQFSQPKFKICSSNGKIFGLYIYKKRLCYIKSWYPFESYILSILDSYGEITNNKILTTFDDETKQYNLDKLNLNEFTTLASRIDTKDYFKHFQFTNFYILANGYYWFYIPSTLFYQFIIFTEKNFKLVGFTAPISYHDEYSHISVSEIDFKISISDKIYLGKKTIEFSELINNFIFHNTTIKSDTIRSYNLKDQFIYDLISKKQYLENEITIDTTIKPPISVNGFNLEKYFCLLPNKHLIHISKDAPYLLYENGCLEKENIIIKSPDTYIYILPENKNVYDILRFYSNATSIGNTVKEVVITLAINTFNLEQNKNKIEEIGKKLDTKINFCNYQTDKNIKLNFENSEFIVLNSSTMNLFNDELANYCISNGILMFIPYIPKRYSDLDPLFIIQYHEMLIDWNDIESIEKWIGFMAGIHDNLYNQRLPHMMEEYLRIAKAKNPLITVLNHENHYFK